MRNNGLLSLGMGFLLACQKQLVARYSTSTPSRWSQLLGQQCGWFLEPLKHIKAGIEI